MNKIYIEVNEDFINYTLVARYDIIGGEVNIKDMVLTDGDMWEMLLDVEKRGTKHIIDAINEYHSEGAEA